MPASQSSNDKEKRKRSNPEGSEIGMIKIRVHSQKKEQGKQD